ncbi:unnamed protein product [Rotaria sordida]|uniref:Uncharacterized protein n=1 Tax=Rotaria sordida TaxID=392033 RepID=A0A815SZ16_9BILA|nr:unnamed protein product [Rotaria sordida]CAF4157957.1 unnamed protein product [Rotaria sordida]
MLKALLSRNFDASSSGASSSKMLFTPYQSLIELTTTSRAPRENTTTVDNENGQDSPTLGQKFIIKACDTRGLNDPNHKDEDTFDAIRLLYSSEFNLINHIFVCFKLDRIRADVHSSIVNLIGYLKKSGFKPENISIALTFCDGYRQAEIDTYVREMKEHPIVGELFQTASKIFIVTLPDLSTLNEKFRQAFEEDRDQIIDNLVNHLATYVKPVQIISHEHFEEVVLMKAKQLTAEETKIHKQEIEQLKEKLIIAGSEYEKVCDLIKVNTQKGIDHDMKQLQQEKQQLFKRVQDLQKQCESQRSLCVIS